jgi:hypothetical protein
MPRHIKLDVSRTNPICEPKSEHQLDPPYPHTHTNTYNKLQSSMPNDATSLKNPFWWKGNIRMFANEDAQKCIYAINSCLFGYEKYGFHSDKSPIIFL